LKDFSNASFPPDIIGIMKDAMDAAVSRTITNAWRPRSLDVPIWVDGNTTLLDTLASVLPGPGIKAREKSPSAHFPFAFSPASPTSRAGFGGAALFLRNARPINPTTTKHAPATINQCGYCIAEPPSRASFSLPLFA
jgi:hypothetical protein